MKSFILAVAMIAIVAGEQVAQCGSGQCGTSSGTNQCSLNSRPRAAEPAAVPQAAPVSLQSVAVTEEWKAPEADSVFKVASYDRISGDSGNDRLQVRPVGNVRVGLLNLGGDRDNGDVQSLLAEERAANRLRDQRLAELERGLVDAQARGDMVTVDEMKRALAQIRPQPTPDEAYELVKQSPRFQADLKAMLEQASPQIGRVEIVSVD